MSLRTSDYRTLAWVALAAATVAVQFARPDWVVYLCWLGCYFALCCGVIAHNHNHCPTFRNKRIDRAFGNVLSIFYGYPTFAWVPTHNLNHHKYVNRAGDATITWRFGNRHIWLIASTYFFVSSYFQSHLINGYIGRARREKPQLYRQIQVQYAVWLGAHVVLIATAVWLHGLKTGLFVWGGACLLPSVFALWSIMLFNYEQHVHTDPWSKHNHSRSWDGTLVNFFLFNNGYHAAHHENPGTHWSKLPELHEKLAPNIDPRLVERNMLWYFLRQYVVALFAPRLGSQQVGRAPFDAPDGSGVSLETADVELGDAGSNTAMLPAAASERGGAFQPRQSRADTSAEPPKPVPAASQL